VNGDRVGGAGAGPQQLVGQVVGLGRLPGNGVDGALEDLERGEPFNALSHCRAATVAARSPSK
jgi:hypothetical protein